MFLMKDLLVSLFLSAQFLLPTGGFPLEDLVAFWKLEEASGTRADAIGANDLTDNNTVTQATGKIGYGAQFTAANSEYLSIADNADLSVTSAISFTLAAWVYLDNKDVSRVFASKTGNGATAEYMLFYRSSTDRLTFIVYTSNGVSSEDVAADALGSPATGTWYFVVAWHDVAESKIKIQVNNGTINETNRTITISDTASIFSLGNDRFNGVDTGLMDGRIDAVGFYKRVLTTAVRSRLYNGGLGRQP